VSCWHARAFLELVPITHQHVQWSTSNMRTSLLECLLWFSLWQTTQGKKENIYNLYLTWLWTVFNVRGWWNQAILLRWHEAGLGQGFLGPSLLFPHLKVRPLRILARRLQLAYGPVLRTQLESVNESLFVQEAHGDPFELCWGQATV